MTFFFEIFTFLLVILIVLFVKKTTSKVDVRQIYQTALLSFDTDSDKNETLTSDSKYSPAPLFEWNQIDEDFERYQKRFIRCSQNYILFVFIRPTDDFCPIINDLLPHCTFSIDLSIENLEKIVTKRSQRFVFLTSGETAQELLLFLHKNPGVRDVTKSIVFLNALFDQNWIKEHFDHQQMDAESNHPIRYICFDDHKNLQTPPIPKSGWKSIDVSNIDHSAQKFSIEEQRSLLIVLDNVLFQ